MSGFDVAARAAVTGAILPGLEVGGETAAVLGQGLGDVVLVGEPDAPRGFAVGVGVNTARHDAYRALLRAGFRTGTTGVTMHRPNEPGYDRDDVLLLDDWR